MYTNVNGMRSARFPLQGLDGNGMFRADIFGKQTGPLGCNCTPMPAIGQDATPGASTVGVMLPFLALGALVIGVGVMASGGGRKHVAANRRHKKSAKKSTRAGGLVHGDPYGRYRVCKLASKKSATIGDPIDVTCPKCERFIRKQTDDDWYRGYFP